MRKKEIQWLTQKVIKEESQKSPRAAFLISIKHNIQIATASKKQFFEAISRNKVSISSKHCGLCFRFIICKKCPLGGNYHGGCCREWKDLRTAILNILTSDEPWKNVNTTANKLIKRLRKEYRKAVLK